MLNKPFKFTLLLIQSCFLFFRLLIISQREEIRHVSYRETESYTWCTDAIYLYISRVPASRYLVQAHICLQPGATTQIADEQTRDQSSLPLTSTCP